MAGAGQHGDCDQPNSENPDHLVPRKIKDPFAIEAITGAISQATSL
jgi:hypothetical protein